jgi:hypothetical protein
MESILKRATWLLAAIDHADLDRVKSALQPHAADLDLSLRVGTTHVLIGVETRARDPMQEVVRSAGLTQAPNVSNNSLLDVGLPEPVRQMAEELVRGGARLREHSDTPLVLADGTTPLGKPVSDGRQADPSPPAGKEDPSRGVAGVSETPSCESFENIASDSAMGSGWNLGKAADPATIKAATNDALEKATKAALAEIVKQPEFTCTPPCVPVWLIVFGPPGSTTAAGGTITVTGSGSQTSGVTVEGASTSSTKGVSVAISPGTLWTDVYVTVTWNVLRACTNPKAASATPGSQPGTPPPAQTVGVGGRVLRAPCSAFSSSKSGSAAVDIDRHVGLGTKAYLGSDPNYTEIQEQARLEAMEKARAAAEAALLALPQCPSTGPCSTAATSIAIGPVVVQASRYTGYALWGVQPIMALVHATCAWSADRVCGA